MLNSMTLSSACDLVALHEGDAAAQILLMHLRRGEIQAFAERYTIRRDSTFDLGGGFCRSDRKELFRSHNQLIDPSFWIEINIEDDGITGRAFVKWETSQAVLITGWYDGRDPDAPKDAKNDYIRLADGIHVPIEDIIKHFPEAGSPPLAEAEAPDCNTDASAPKPMSSAGLIEATERLRQKIETKNLTREGQKEWLRQIYPGNHITETDFRGIFKQLPMRRGAPKKSDRNRAANSGEK